jgi:hypothetical protein
MAITVVIFAQNVRFTRKTSWILVPSSDAGGFSFWTPVM